MTDIITLSPAEKDPVKIVFAIRQLAERQAGNTRTRLTQDRDYFVSTTGSDGATGATAATAFLSINKAMTVVARELDLNGDKNVQIRVQGGTYTENLTTMDWVGYGGNGFNQFTVIGENGTVVVTGATATATILAAVAESPIRFKNITIGNANAKGIGVEGDDGGLIVLDACTFGTFGSGGIAIAAIARGGRILLMNGTHTFDQNVATGIYCRNNATVICQPAVTLALGTGRVFSNAFVDVASGGEFHNTGLTVTGTLGSSSIPYRLDVDSGGQIDDADVLAAISGAGTPVLTAVTVAHGGTGAKTVPTARTALGLSGIVTSGDSNHTITAAECPVIFLAANLTAARTWTLPLASSVEAGRKLIIADGGGINGANTLTVQRQSSDSFLGVGVAANAIVLPIQYSTITVISDGATNWFLVAKT